MALFGSASLYDSHDGTSEEGQCPGGGFGDGGHAEVVQRPAEAGNFHARQAGEAGEREGLEVGQRARAVDDAVVVKSLVTVLPSER